MKKIIGEYTFEERLKKDNEYKRMVQSQIYNLVGNIAYRFHPIEKRFIFDMENFEMFPYFFVEYYKSLYCKNHIKYTVTNSPDEFEIYINGKRVFEQSISFKKEWLDHENNPFSISIGEDTVTSSLSSAKNSFKYTCKSIGSYYIIKFCSEEFIINSEKFEFKIDKHTFGGRDGDLAVNICINDIKDNIDTYYIIQPTIF